MGGTFDGSVITLTCDNGIPLSSAKTTLFLSLIGLVGSSDSLDEEEEEQSSGGRITRQGRRGEAVLKGGGKLVDEATRQLRAG